MKKEVNASKQQEQKEQKRKFGLKVASAIFAIMAILHFIRLLTRAEAVILGWQVPLGVSLIALATAGSLSVWLYNLTCGD